MESLYYICLTIEHLVKSKVQFLPQVLLQGGEKLHLDAEIGLEHQTDQFLESLVLSQPSLLLGVCRH